MPSPFSGVDPYLETPALWSDFSARFNTYLRQPLPAILIPLLAPDPDVWIDLGAVFRATYERGRYARSIDYAGAPPVHLDAARLAWVTQQARADGSA
jgi:hypothetical protein